MLLPPSPIRIPKNPLKARYETGLAIVPLADFRGERLPLRIESGTLVTTSRFLEIQKSRRVVVAFTRIDDAHAQGTKDLRRDAGITLGQALCRRLGGVVAQALQLLVAGAVDPFGKTLGLLALSHNSMSESRSPCSETAIAFSCHTVR